MKVNERSWSMELREVILNTRKPIVLRGFHPTWKCFDCSLDVWCRRFDDNYLSENKIAEFEQMTLKSNNEPQWERRRTKTKMTLTDFLEKHSKDPNNWHAFYYKPLNDIPDECSSGLDFSCFGFPDAAKSASFWLSSKCANTPCHYDTYGCNIVVQIYGRKHWLLFPPETKLTPTRVPYEESSVYCYENFYCPKDLTQMSDASQNAFECILEEGDVLVVPRHWWHYVESLEVSLSVNTWIPLKIDTDAQVKECIVKYLVEKSVIGEATDHIKYVLNPNQLDLVTSSTELLGILRLLLENNQTTCDEKYHYEYLSETEVDGMLRKLPYKAHVIRQLCPADFFQIVCTKMKRHDNTISSEELTTDPLQEALLNSICHPNVIEIVQDNLLKIYARNIKS